MADATVELRGVSRLRHTLEQAQRDLEDMERANLEAAQIVASASASRSPRVSGRLAGSLVGARLKARAAVTSDAPYAHVILEGYAPHNITANPFVDAAATETQDQWTRVYDHDLQRIANTIQGV